MAYDAPKHMLCKESVEIALHVARTSYTTWLLNCCAVFELPPSRINPRAVEIISDYPSVINIIEVKFVLSSDM
jgi:hypothetical protein